MSAIAGIFHRHGRPATHADLQPMIDVLAHRGPDRAGLCCHGPAGLGHRLLWTTPESLHEILPLVHDAGRLVLTADARIDNRDELIRALDLDDRPPAEMTDSHLILAAYERWGQRCPEHLLGDFAFAIWDGRRQTFFCARDHLGVKPFYYYLSGQLFAFASEIKALFCLAEVPQRLNEERVADYLAFIFDDATVTFYQDIVRLEPACSLLVQRESTAGQSYWSLDPTRDLKLASDEAYAEAFRHIFTQAVSCRLRSAFPVGSLLSGGLDSSSIACVAARLLADEGRGPLPTFSAIFDEVTECDERPFIDAVLAQGNFVPHTVHGDRLNLFDHVDSMHWHLDEPFFAPNLVMGWGLNRCVQDNNVRVLLDGFDGDSAVSHGYGYLKELARAGRWLALATNVRGAARIHNSPAWWPYWAYLRAYQLQPLLDRSPPVRRTWQKGRTWWRRAQSWSGQAARLLAWDALVNPDFAGRTGLQERYRASRQGSPEAALTEREQHYRVLTQGLRPFALEVLDKAAAAFAVEPRYPFWDRRLVEFCLALPPEQKLHRGWSRVVLRRAMAGILPLQVQWRAGKLDFSPNVAHGLRTFGRQYLDSLIYNDAAPIQAYVNVPVLQQAYRQFLSEDDARSRFLVWQAASLALWLPTAHSFWLDSREKGGDANGKSETNGFRQEGLPRAHADRLR
jgi:asparagine synthase (glutamine-hydrolysing)